jgi:hypothetical protein
MIQTLLILSSLSARVRLCDADRGLFSLKSIYDGVFAVSPSCRLCSRILSASYRASDSFIYVTVNVIQEITICTRK